MRTLEEQLRDYGEYRSEMQGAINVLEVTSPAGADSARARPSRRGWLVGIAAAATVLLIGGLSTLISGAPHSDVVDSTPSTRNSTTTLGLTTTQPSPESARPVTSLERVDPPDWINTVEMTEPGLASTGEEFVMCDPTVYVATQSGDQVVGGSWYATSPDGASWDRVDIPADRSRFDCEQVWGDIAAWATGDPADPDSGYEAREVEVLTRAGEVVNHDFDSEVYTVAVSSDRVLAFVESGIWHSEDGANWTLAANAPSSVLQIIGARDGFYIIEHTGGPSDPLEVWFSIDGADWEHIGTAMGGWGELQRWGSSAVWIGYDRPYYLLTPDGVTESVALPEPPSDPYTTGAVEVDGRWATGGEAGELVVSTNGLEGRISAVEFIPRGHDRQPVQTDAAINDSWFVEAAALGDIYLLITRDDDGAITFWRGEAARP